MAHRECLSLAESQMELRESFRYQAATRDGLGDQVFPRTLGADVNAVNARIASFIAALAGLVLEPAGAGPIDFTPVTVRSVEDGIPVTRTAFKDGDKRFFFRPAKGWRLAGGGTEVTIYPTDQLAAYIRLGNCS